jgi:predicted RND superfamily exporter protein
VTSPPSIDELPDIIKRGLMTQDGSGEFVLGIYPNLPRRDGHEAMRFARELYGLSLPDSAKGPIGEMPVFAEILWLVTGEGPLIVVATLIGVALIVFLGYRSLKDTCWTVFPLLGGMALALGIMAVSGLKLNFFNVVVIPALLGLGIDHGVHYYRLWKELGRDTVKTQRELFGPLTTCTLTTMMGYSGMAFARHEGLRSIGLVACLGLAAIWFVSLVVFPGILSWIPMKRGRTRE